MDCYVDVGFLFYGCDGVFGECVFGYGVDVDVVVEFGVVVGVDGVGGDFGVVDDGCVYLVGVDGGVVVGDGVVDYEVDGRGGIGFVLGGEDDIVGGD